MAAQEKTPDRRSFLEFVRTPSELRNMGVEERIEALEGKLVNITTIEQKLDRVLQENDSFRKEVYNLTKENCELLRGKIDLENKYSLLGKQYDELKKKFTEMERKLCESEERSRLACMTIIDSKMDEVKKNNDEAQTGFREIIKQQEEERRELAQSEIVRVIQQKETMVRNIAEKKRSIVVSGLKEENIRNWQERKRMEEERIKNLFSKISEEEDVFVEVEDYIRLGKYEEGKSRAMKIRLKSQVTAERLISMSWKLKDTQETRMIYVKRNMTQEERVRMRELITEARERNEARSEDDKTKFFWKVRNEKVWKWWINGRE